MKHGAAHAQGDYEVDHSQGTFLENGIYAITDVVGLDSVKIFLSPAYDVDYPTGDFGAGITSLATLAADPLMASVLANPSINDYFINCFTFNDNNSSLFKFGFEQQPYYLSAEYTEMRDLAEYLLTTYSGTGKTFTLQTWEGDWALINSRDANNLDQPLNDPTNYVRSRTPNYMAAWCRTRISAVEDARKAIGSNDVRVYSSIELNRIRDVYYDRSRIRVLNSVLPFCRPDRVSYSAYDSIFGPGFSYYDTQAELIANTVIDLGKAIDLIRRAAPHSEVYLGEYGFAETELPEGYSAGPLIENIATICENKELTHALYWQIWDNEGGRGFYLEKSDGDLSEAGTYLASL